MNKNLPGGFNPHKESIKKINVPDEAVHEWYATLRENGFSEKDINMILSGLNENWKKLNNPDQNASAFEDIVRHFEKKIGVKLQAEETEALKKGFYSLQALFGDELTPENVDFIKRMIDSEFNQL